MSKDVFVAEEREPGGLAGVFEYDGETAYFYIYDRARPSGKQIIAASHIKSGTWDLREEDVEIRWSSHGNEVHLFVRAEIRAAFDIRTGRAVAVEPGQDKAILSQEWSPHSEPREFLELLDEAEAFLKSLPWCRSVTNIRLGLAHPGIFGVCLAEIENSASPRDSKVWVVVGDLPPAYLVIDDAESSRQALERYVEEMSKWVERVQSDGNLEDVIPVNVPPTREAAAALSSRLSFLRRRFLAPSKPARRRLGKS